VEDRRYESWALSTGRVKDDVYGIWNEVYSLLTWY